MSTAAQTDMVPVDQQAMAPAPSAASPQFFRGFDGAAVEPFPEHARKVLAEPPDDRDVEIKPDGIVFLPGVAYRRILTRAFGAGGWALLPRSPARVMGNIVVYHGALVCLGRFVAEAVGECFYRENNPNMSYASCVEGAKTDALTRCCKDLGVATDLWDANWREKWKAKYAVSYRGKKWDGRKQVEVETTLWKLKDRVSNPHDLMAGAGGVDPAPATTATDSAASQPAAPAGSAGSSAGRAAAPASGSTRPAADTASDPGDPASEESKAAIRAEVKRRKWKPSYARLWLQEYFGQQSLDALSQQEADRALVAIMQRPVGEVTT